MYMATNTHRKKILFVALACLIFCTFCGSAVAVEKDIWDDGPAQMPGKFRLTDEKIEQILNHIAEKAPQRAEELRQLRKEDSDKFKEQIRAELAKMRPPEKGGPESLQPGRRISPRRLLEGAGPPSERGRGPARGGRWRENMQKSHEEYIRWLEKNYPDEAQELAQLQENNPDQYFRSAFASRRKYGRIMEAEKRNPELAEVLKEDLEIQKLRVGLLEQVNQADGKKREELVKELESLVSRRFDLIVRKKQLQYEDLQKRLEKMQAELKQRQLEVEKLQESKGKALKERLAELIGQNEKVNWE